MARIPDISQTEIDELILRHSSEIGRVAINWNALHEALGQLFAAILSPEHQSLALAIWNAIKNDRTQREVLQATAREKLGDKSRICQDIKWMLGQIPNLEDNRNTAVHAPYTITFDDSGAIKFGPSLFYGNKRALNLKDKDLTLEFTSYMERMATLMQFARSISWHIDRAEDVPTWPPRPALPRPAQSMTQTEQRPRTDDK